MSWVVGLGAMSAVLLMARLVFELDDEEEREAARWHLERCYQLPEVTEKELF